MRIIIILIALSIFSCRSIQYVPVETTEIENDSIHARDSVVTQIKTDKKDSSNISEKTVKSDSTIMRDSSVIVVNEQGNVIKEERFHTKEIYRSKEYERKESEYRELKTKYEELQLRYEALFAEKQNTKEVPYPVEVVKNKVPGIMWWLIILLAAFSIPSVLKIIRFIRGKI